PFLVVIMIAPLDPCEPYNAAAPAPFNTLMLSTSSGLIFPNTELGTIELSTTNNAVLSPKIERLPSSTKRTVGFTPLDTAFTCNPGTLACRPAATLIGLP